MDSDSYYWFYSTLAQVLGALVALLGVFAIFALQQISISYNETRRKFINWLERHGICGFLTAEYLADVDLLAKANEWSSKNPNSEEANRIEKMAQILLKSNIHSIYVKRDTVKILIGTIFLLSASLILLPLCKSWTILIIILIMAIVLLIWIGRFIIKTFKYGVLNKFIKE